MSEPIRVFLVDDQELVRAGFRMLIDSQPDLTVVGEAGDGGDATATPSATSTDAIPCGIVMADATMTGVSRARAISATIAYSGGPPSPASNSLGAIAKPGR